MAKKIRKDFSGNTAMDMKKSALREKKSWGNRPGDDDEMINGNVIIFSPENFGDDCITPDGLFDGDMPCRDNPFVPLSELEAVDIYGNPISPEKMYTGDFTPDDIDFLDVYDWEDDLDFPDDDFYPEWWENRRTEGETIDECVVVNGEVLTEEVADEIWDRCFWRDPLEDSLFWEELRLELKDEDDTSLRKKESCSPEISCQKKGTYEPRAWYRIMLKKNMKSNLYSGMGFDDEEKREKPENDRHKDHRVRISPRQAKKLNEFLGEDFCHQTIFAPRIAVTFGFQSKRRFKRPELISTNASPIIELAKEIKETKKPDHKGYFNRRVAMARR